MEETIIYLPTSSMTSKDELIDQLMQVSREGNTTICHIEFKELEKKPTFKAGLIYHTAGSNFKKELVSFINGVEAEKRMFITCKKM